MTNKIYWVYVFSLSFFVASSISFGWGKESLPLAVSFLDVGQGDAILITYRDNFQILVDGGPDGTVLLEQLANQMPPSDRLVDIVVLTHPDLDHLGGLIDLVNRYQVGWFLDNGLTSESDAYRELMERVKQKSIHRHELTAGWQLEADGQLAMETLWPPDLDQSDSNSGSLVEKLVFGENEFLLTGDVETKVENQLLPQAEKLKSDWLKISHHGSKNASSEKFLHVVQPKHAIISVGLKNRFGHPSDEVIERLQKQNTEIIRTDRDGTVTVRCDQQQCRKEIEK